MPKIKTHRGAAKRFKKTGTGKIKRSKAFRSHLLTCKNAKKIKNLRRGALVDKANLDSVRKMLPY